MPPHRPSPQFIAQLENLVRAQERDFIAQNPRLTHEQMSTLLAQYRPHFIAVASARIQASASMQGPGRPNAVPPQHQNARNEPSVPSGAISLEQLESGIRSARITPARSPPPPRAIIPKMTDKDLELVFRMHLRQLETSKPYRDDFYSVAYRLRHGGNKEEAAEDFDMYSELGIQLSTLSDHVHQRRPQKDRTARRKRERGQRKNEKTSKNSNLKALTSVLGTIQAWNPKARTRVMDLNLDRSGEDENKTNAVNPLSRVIREHRDGEEFLLRDDERIRVRSAVEEGYDILGKLQDVVRKYATHDVKELLEQLVGTLRLPASNSGDDEDDFSSFDGIRFFVRMCMFEKGKLYIARVLAVLPPDSAAHVCCAVFEHLNTLIYSIDESSEDTLWVGVIAAIQRTDFPPQSCMDLLSAFYRTHCGDSGAVVIALSSPFGAKLLYVAMQRIFTAQNGDEPVELTGDDQWNELCSALTSRLGGAFDSAETTAASENIWEVAAMLDALSTGPAQAMLRTTLKELLDSARAPPPPTEGNA